MKWLMTSVLSVMLFSIWAIFALLVVNPYLQATLPGYTIGRICIWEVIMFVVSVVIARWLIWKWGALEIREEHGKKKLSLHANYGVFFVVYLVAAIIVSVYQFWLFSQNF